jgi:hypothetical protein
LNKTEKKRERKKKEAYSEIVDVNTQNYTASNDRNRSRVNQRIQLVISCSVGQRGPVILKRGQSCFGDDPAEKKRFIEDHLLF